MKKINLFLILFIAIAVNMNIVFSHENFNKTKQLIDSKIPCKDLSNEQLEEIGDYYMEQIHPGKSHELMHQMMGGEDSIAIKQMHIQMAKSIYCGESSYGMMGMMNMMGGGMMPMMMGSYYDYGFWGVTNVLWVIFLILLIVAMFLVIVWLYKKISKK